MAPRKIPLPNRLTTATNYPTLNGLGLPRQLVGGVQQAFQLIYGLRDMLGELNLKPGIVTFGLSDDKVGTNTPEHYGNVHWPGLPVAGSLSCVTPPTTADAVFDVLVSHDRGATWSSIFSGGHPFRFPAGSSADIVEFEGIFGQFSFAVGDLLRVDTIQSGGAKGITGVIRWQ
jgi:hypothetical protein